MEDNREQGGGRRRKRVSRACDRCRSKKDRCDGVRPTCLACQTSGSVCSYDPTAKKRGLPEGYVRGLEKLWALSISNIEGFEANVLALLGANDEISPRRTQLESLWLNESISDKLHESWKSSDLYAELEKLLSTVESEANSAPVSRDIETYGFSLEQPPADYRDVTYALRASQHFNANDCFSPKAKRLKLDPELSSVSDSSSLSLPPQTTQLLDTYFSHTHIWLPIVAKHAILRTSYLYATGPVTVSNSSSGCGNHAALWAILSYTTVQQRNPSKPTGDPLVEAKKYYKIARSLFPSDDGTFEIGHVQALLLLTLVNIGLEDWTAAWLLIGEATRLAIRLGLGQLVHTRQSPRDAQGNAVFLGCFLIDTFLSIRLNHHPHLRAEDVQHYNRLDEDGLEEWSPWTDFFNLSGQLPYPGTPGSTGPVHAHSCFNRLVELAGILNRICSLDSFDLTAPFFCQTILKDLQAWEARLPPICRLRDMGYNMDGGSHPVLLPHQAYLCLTHIATLSFLYQRFSSQLQTLFYPLRNMLNLASAILESCSKNFPQCAFPPLFEFALRFIVGGGRLEGLNVNDSQFQFTAWSESISREDLRPGTTWPVLTSFSRDLEQQRQSHSMFYPSVPQLNHFSAPAIPGSLADMVRPQHDPASEPYLDDAVIFKPVSHSISGLGISGLGALNNQKKEPRGTHCDTIQIPSPENSTNGKFSSGTDDDSFSLPTNLMSHLAGANVTERPHDEEETRQASYFNSIHSHPITPESSSPNPISKSLTLSSGSASSPSRFEDLNPLNELDSIFNDLAHLDTHEWTTSREQGLKDFGFPDDTAFQAFCRDPDRLTESKPLLRPSSIADIWPPPGFFPDTFKEESSSDGPKEEHNAA
ncbi:hypothetical protein FQN57_005524 [Myotisia sp. PD_48]|nr:hypothetical protein FQN57_005524 [Myotisia sp. PD_48]